VATDDNQLAAPDGNALASVDFNYGNIRPVGASTGFNSYATPQAGIAAMAANLAAYRTLHGINTLNGLTARWAPKGDGNNNPAAYAKSLGAKLGLDPDAEIDLTDPLLQSRLIPAMATIEKGRPFGASPDVLTAGIQQGLGGMTSPPSVAAATAPPAAPVSSQVAAAAPPVNALSSLNTQAMSPMQRLTLYRQLAQLFAPPQRPQQAGAVGPQTGGVDASIPLRVV
jgi:hypothetical protein